MERWKDRDWEPSEEEVGFAANLRHTDGGEVLLRLIDRQMLLSAEECMMVTQDPPTEYIGMQEVTRFRGFSEALQLVKSWLLAERDSQPESQEIQNG